MCEYFIKMRELGTTHKIDDSSVMKYVIKGISDGPMNKSVLYGATNFKEFKAKLRAYEDFKETSNFQRHTSTKYRNDSRYEHAKKEKSDVRCFSCGAQCCQYFFYNYARFKIIF